MPTPLATLAELYTYGAPESAFQGLSTADRSEGILAASAEAEASLRSRGTLPLLAWDLAITLRVCQIAAYELMSRVGFNPNAGSDTNYLLRAQDARVWLRAVSKGEIVPGVTFSSPPTMRGAARVRSLRRRGW